MIAALDGQALWLEAGPNRDVRWDAACSCRVMFLGMEKIGIQVLYVHASALAKLGLPEQLGIEREPHPWVDGVKVRGQRVSTRSLAPSIEAAGMEILIGAYQDQDRGGGPFTGAKDGEQLLAAAMAFRDAFDPPFALRNSSAVTGWKLMHAPWTARTSRGRRLEHTAFDFSETAPFSGQVEVPYGGKWARARSQRAGGRQRLPWVHAYDVNGQRLAACARLALGIGKMEHGRRPFDKALPGYWKVKKISNPFRGLIPPMMEPGWHTTPRVAMANYLGLQVEITDAMVWTSSVSYLDPWYDKMRDARSNLLARDDDAGRIAMHALKQAYLRPLGQLRSEKSKRSGSLHYRPGWYDTVIGQELGREYLRLHQLATAGVRVLAVYFDTIIIETANPNPAEAVDGILFVSEQLGKYSIVGSLPTDIARGLLYSPERGADVGALVKGIKATHAVINQGRIRATRVTVRQRPIHGGYPG